MASPVSPDPLAVTAVAQQPRYAAYRQERTRLWHAADATWPERKKSVEAWLWTRHFMVSL